MDDGTIVEGLLLEEFKRTGVKERRKHTDMDLPWPVTHGSWNHNVVAASTDGRWQQTVWVTWDEPAWMGLKHTLFEREKIKQEIEW